MKPSKNNKFTAFADWGNRSLVKFFEDQEVEDDWDPFIDQTPSGDVSYLFSMDGYSLAEGSKVSVYLDEAKTSKNKKREYKSTSQLGALEQLFQESAPSRPFPKQEEKGETRERRSALNQHSDKKRSSSRGRSNRKSTQSRKKSSSKSPKEGRSAGLQKQKSSSGGYCTPDNKAKTGSVRLKRESRRQISQVDAKSIKSKPSRRGMFVKSKSLSALVINDEEPKNLLLSSPSLHSRRERRTQRGRSMRSLKV